MSEDRSYWNATAGEPPVFPRLESDLEVDVAIVGGGIVGVTTARLLKDEGLKVALIEARRVGREVTGKSTAKVTSQHGIRYSTLEGSFGENRARLYAEAQEAGLARIRALAAENRIDAHIEEKPAFLYTRDPDRVTHKNRAMSETMAGAATRAVIACSPIHLPPELHDRGWDDFELGFAYSVRV